MKVLLEGRVVRVSSYIVEVNQREMTKARIEIRDDYTRYTSLIYERKTSQVNPIYFDRDKPSRTDFIYHLSSLIHIAMIDQVQLIAEQRKFNNCSYKFQIRCSDFCVEPLFRFDSDGSTHQNKSDPLAVQQVPTPHFNCFNPEGFNHAYQTDEMKDVEYSELQDMQRFFAIFCEECYIVFGDDEPLEILKGDQRELDLNLHNEDFLADVNFEI